MKKLFALFVVFVFLCGCLGESSEDCAGDECKVDLPPPKKESNCGDGILEPPEECEVGTPCESGFCDKCRCKIYAGNEVVTDCETKCRSLGYDFADVVADGECTYMIGEDNPCAIRCSYRDVYPSDQEGMVCCCRAGKYIPCEEKVFEDGCECPSQMEAAKLCKENKPGQV